MPKRIYEIPTLEPSKMDWARLAAYIDGEGNIQIAVHRSKNRQKELVYTSWRLSVQVANTDPRLPNWCRDIFGGRVCSDQRAQRDRLTKRDGYKRKTMWMWMVGPKHSEWVLRGCLPYFVIKHEQAEVAIAYRDTYKVRTCKRGVPLDVRVVEQRFIASGKLKELHKTAPVTQETIKCG
jgi:hypothetical protein